MTKEKKIYDGERTVSSVNSVGKMQHAKKRKKPDHYLITYTKTYTKISSKWIEGLTVRPKTIKLLKENIGSTLFNTNLSNVFLDMSLQTRKQKQK